MESKMKITVDCRRPGSKKSYGVKKFIKQHSPKFIIFSKEHELLNEYEELPRARHIHGASSKHKAMCKYRNDEMVQELLERSIPISYICDFKQCETKECPYHNQFKRVKNLLMPLQYIGTNRVDLSKFEYIVIDEGMDGCTTIEWDEPRILSNLGILDWEELYVAIKKRDLDYIEEHIGGIKKRIGWNNRMYAKTGDFQHIITTNFDHLLYFLRMTALYGEQDSFELPDVYKLFDAGEDVKWLSATYDRTLMTAFIMRYQREINPAFKCEIELIEDTEDVQSDTQVYRIGTKLWTKRHMHSHIDETMKIVEHLSNLCTTQEKMCIVTYKEFITDGKCFGHDAFHFNSKKGVNTYEHHDIMLVLGTYTLSDDGYRKQYRIENPSTTPPEISMAWTGDMWLPTNEAYIDIGTRTTSSVMYDSIHRIRPCRATRSIYIAGVIPEQLKTEFPCTIIPEIILR